METNTLEFTNWSKQYSSKPGISVIPDTPEEIQEIIRSKNKFPSPVVAIGSGHSNSGCNVVNGGTAIRLKKFKYIKEPADSEVTAGAGVQLFELHRYLAERKLQLPFTPEIGNATIGSVACCCLKDAAIGKSSGIATGMLRAIKFIDAAGNLRSMKRGDEGWQMITCSHGLFGIIYEATFDVIPMKLVIQNYVRANLKKKNFEEVYRKALAENDGIFGLADTSTGKLTLETRNFSEAKEKPRRIERIYNKLDRKFFKYFNPTISIIKANWWGRRVRKASLAGFRFFRFSFPRGRRTFKNLKPIDYSYKYPYRWDFHFWAYPVSIFPTVVFPAFVKFLKEYKKRNPSFDEKGLMACYRIRVEKNSLLSPSYDEDRMTLDPVRPMTRNTKVMKAWDDFCFEYNDFAVKHQGKCTFNQTKVLSRSQVEKAFGDKWEQFKKARKEADPEDRLLSNYFRGLMYGS